MAALLWSSAFKNIDSSTRSGYSYPCFDEGKNGLSGVVSRMIFNLTIIAITGNRLSENCCLVS